MNDIRKMTKDQLIEELAETQGRIGDLKKKVAELENGLQEERNFKEALHDSLKDTLFVFESVAGRIVKHFYLRQAFLLVPVRGQNYIRDSVPFRYFVLQPYKHMKRRAHKNVREHEKHEKNRESGNNEHLDQELSIHRASRLRYFRAFQ